MTNSSRHSANQLSVISHGQWRQALFTTFTLNLGFFEAYVLPKLLTGGCNDITLLVDEGFYQSTLAESAARHVGSTYRLLPVSVQGGVFHAKLTYLSEQNGDDVLMVGSGNMTWTGYGHQLECLEVLRARRDAAAFRDFADVLRQLLSRKGIHVGAARGLIQGVAERASKAHEAAHSTTQVRLLGSLVVSISEQVAAALKADGPFDRVVVMSPFHTPDAGPVLRLAQALGCETVEIALDGRSLVTPVAQTNGLSFVQRESDNDTRPTHAKWYEFHGMRPWLLTGSVNATQTSLESISNFEVATLRPATAAMLGRWKPCQPSGWGVMPAPIVHCSNRTSIAAELMNPRTISGRFLDDSTEHDGSWSACLIRDGSNVGLPSVDVDRGAFAIRLGQTTEIQDAEPCQLILERGEMTAAGWLMYEAELRLSREEREFSRRVRRLFQGKGENHDFIGVVTWLTERVGLIGIGSPRTTSGVRAGEKLLPVSDAPFDYTKWVAHAGYAGRQLSHLGTCRFVLKALARFAAKPRDLDDRSARFEAESHDFDLSETTGDETTNTASGRPNESTRSLESLQQTLERALEGKEVAAQAATFVLEALLWTLILNDRAARRAPLDALPFAKWMTFARPYLEGAPFDPVLALLALGAMACAFAFKADDEPRAEAFSVLAKRAAGGIAAHELAAKVGNVLSQSPSFSQLTPDQAAAAVAAIPGLLTFEGFATQLRKFLRDWSAARGLLMPPSFLSSGTGGVIDELRGRRGTPNPYIEHTSQLPTRCPGRCCNVFDGSDVAVLRHRRALRCTRCGILHFWTAMT